MMRDNKAPKTLNAEALKQDLARVGYVADDGITTALELALTLERPLLLEGNAGVGKTEVAKALAGVLHSRLIRLQCYEGLDAQAAIYEWNYRRQLLAIRAMDTSTKAQESAQKSVEQKVFSEEYLLRRPLLEAISVNEPVVLLIDEIDRADEEFEAYLLEILSDYQITIPELGTFSAKSIPRVILTSNGTRDLSDALRRRCLYSYIDYPDEARELAIIRAKVPHAGEDIAQQITTFVRTLRAESLEKVPGISETLDWTAALVGLDISSLSGDVHLIHKTMLCLLKTQADISAITPEVIGRIAAGRAA